MEPGKTQTLVWEPAGCLGSGLKVSEGTLGLQEGGSRVHPLGWRGTQGGAGELGGHRLEAALPRAALELAKIIWPKPLRPQPPQ